MLGFKIKSGTLAKRCEVCHQSDMLYVQSAICRRCRQSNADIQAIRYKILSLEEEYKRKREAERVRARLADENKTIEEKRAEYLQRFEGWFEQLCLQYLDLDEKMFAEFSSSDYSGLLQLVLVSDLERRQEKLIERLVAWKQTSFVVAVFVIFLFGLFFLSKIDPGLIIMPAFLSFFAGFSLMANKPELEKSIIPEEYHARTQKFLDLGGQESELPQWWRELKQYLVD